MTTIDLERVAESIDLIAMAERDGVEVRNSKALCPFHDNRSTPALSFFKAGDRWRFRCHSCDAKGDAFTWRSMIDRIPLGDAMRKLAGVDPLDRPAAVSAGRAPEPARSSRKVTHDESWREAIWQATVEQIVADGVRWLWSPEGWAALAWLRARGLEDHTIRLFRLGYNPRRYRAGPAGLNVERGVLLPWAHPEAWYGDPAPTDAPRWVGCNVRRVAEHDDAADFGDPPAGVDKCKAIAGKGLRGFGYPFGADFIPGRPVLVTEGEWDALIAWQELGWICNVVSCGGNNQSPRSESLEAMAVCPLWLLASHPGPSGQTFAEKWEARAEGKARRLTLPGVDLNDLHRQGPGLVRDWLREEYDLLDLPWPARDGSSPTPRVVLTWDQELAGWPHPAWSRWHRRSGELLAFDPRGPRSVEAITEARRAAYLKVRESLV